MTQGPPTSAAPPPPRWHRWVPWISLAMGVASALTMDRGPQRARIVAVAACMAWVVMLATLLLHGDDDAPRGRWRGGIRWTALAITQWAIQLALFFSLPLYWRAWAGTMPQLVFVIVLSVAALFSLWDPWTEWLLHRPGLGAALPALASFAGLGAVLPGLGLSNSQSLWAAALATSAALPVGLVRLSGDAIARRRLVVGTSLAMLLLPAALGLGAARLIPAAPLALLEAEIGTRQQGRGGADPIDHLSQRPQRLVCATVIAAPLGVHERLFHVWRQDGEVRDRIELQIAGGREAGFRTWSSKRRFGQDPAGRWSCAVETGMGQSLGATTIEIEIDRED